MSGQIGSAGWLNLDELELLAKQTLPKMNYDYFSSGAETQQSVADNRASFSQYRLLPRILVDVSKVDTSCTMFGYKMAMPLMVAPMAMHGLAHSSKELGTARGSAAANVPMVVSTMANMGLQEIAASAGHPCLLFQLYVIRDRQVVTSWVRQAEAAGYKALVITVDAQRLGRREADEHNRFTLPDHLQMANLQPLADKRTAQQQSQGEQGQLLNVRDSRHGSGLFQLFAKEVDDSLTWEFIPWLRTVTKLPIFVKGVLSPADALLALDYRVDGIVVSNHGGRQLDYSPSALDMLPGVVAAVAGRVPVLVDGGIRRGTDLLKALALGATAVLLGRPVLYGLAIGGQEGVQQVLESVQREFELAMALSGCRTVQDIGPHLLLQLTGAGLKPVTLPGSGSGWGSGQQSFCGSCSSSAASLGKVNTNSGIQRNICSGGPGQHICCECEAAGSGGGARHVCSLSSSFSSAYTTHPLTSKL